MVECHLVTGEYTLLIKIQCYNNEHLMTLLNEKIQAIDGILSTTTLISLEQTIYRTLHIPEVEMPVRKHSR